MFYSSADDNSQSPDIFWCLSGQTQFDLTWLIYIINGKVNVFIKGKKCPDKFQPLL